MGDWLLPYWAPYLAFGSSPVNGMAQGALWLNTSNRACYFLAGRRWVRIRARRELVQWLLEEVRGLWCRFWR